MAIEDNLKTFDGDMTLSGFFEVEGFGMVRIQAAPYEQHQLWLPFEPIPVQMRLM